MDCVIGVYLCAEIYYIKSIIVVYWLINSIYIDGDGL